ncbi:serine hydrolase domain-containing protein [Rhizobium leguminosarum]|jgi:CubicO group peptidase (beta-lactamase class C family)|uniref:Beta-lactamase n=1 Tax=Rhizobium leguminosarum bv. trifolii TaxID=386 RepID=A0A1C9I3C5_RHILT|nr:serine hydrolase domain-containing protein [Rhizobium leguminosarum]AOO93488.1 beta-lactamase [Rhizobium leguminosarum bv. trifolii]
METTARPAALLAGIANLPRPRIGQALSVRFQFCGAKRSCIVPALKGRRRLGKLDSKVDAVFADMDVPQHPGAALLVIDRDEIVYSKCYGLADLETLRPITTDTSFYLASISKQFTAMAAMLLAEQGRLSFDDRLSVYFPQLPSWSAEISLRHLLHHTAGLPDYFQLFSSSATTVSKWTRDMTDVTNAAVLDRLVTAEPDFATGAKHAYSNTGYVILSMIVARVSGQSFADFLKANVFNPLGMKNTVVFDASRPARYKLAHGYWDENARFERWDYPLLTTGDGGIFSTLDDFFLWDRALNTERLVSKATMDEAFTSGATHDGGSVGYGFGWMTDVSPYLTQAEPEQLLTIGGDGLRYVAHGGNLVAYNNYVVRFLDTRRTIIVMTNHRGVPGPRIRAHQVGQILFSE